MASALQGPGILWVQSRIKPEWQGILDEPTFLKWYDEDHIPEIIATSGIKTALRFVHVDKSSQADESIILPFLAYYPMDDVAFTMSDEFKNIRVKSDILPNGGIIYDLADFDISYFALKGVSRAKEGEDTVKYALSVHFDTKGGLDPNVIETYNEQMAAAVAQASGYMRTLSFQLQLNHSNAQTGKTDTVGGVHLGKLSWLCIYEYSARPEDAIIRALAQILERHMGTARSAIQLWELEKISGESKYFG